MFFASIHDDDRRSKSLRRSFRVYININFLSTKHCTCQTIYLVDEYLYLVIALGNTH